MILDFIEIGTSDFDTEIKKSITTKGISIEPVKYYLDNLPNKIFVKKVNMAITDHNGYCDVWYMPEEKIKQYGFPRWVRGCNSINDYHPTILRLIQKRTPEISPCELLESYKVKCSTLCSFLKTQREVSGIYYLKIDTEGHDIVILNKFIDEVFEEELFDYLPHKIKFESNSLSNKTEVDNLIQKLKDIGYNLIKRGHDTTMGLFGE